MRKVEAPLEDEGDRACLVSIVGEFIEAVKLVSNY